MEEGKKTIDYTHTDKEQRVAGFPMCVFALELSLKIRYYIKKEVDEEDGKGEGIGMKSVTKLIR